jgi:hypothetical protein
MLCGTGVLALLLTVVITRKAAESASSETVFEIQNKPAQAAPMCPWREPEKDLKAFFPNATRYQAETHILSGVRPELATLLGRIPTGDENALRVYGVYSPEKRLGSVMTRRVKGTCGAIEIVLATDTNMQIRGMRLQRLREPESVARALENPEWMQWFVNKTADGVWDTGTEISLIPPDAQDSAKAIVEGARSLIILLAAADPPAQTGVPPHHH